MTDITIMYSCNDCRLKRVRLEVPARQDESVTDWMDATVLLVARDHRRRSPLCQAKTITDLMIPITGTDRVGGATIQ